MVPITTVDLTGVVCRRRVWSLSPSSFIAIIITDINNTTINKYPMTSRKWRGVGG